MPAPRKLRFEPGYRECFWHRNCVAVGQAAGFIEPLEASALAMVELSAAMLADALPATREAMAVAAQRGGGFDELVARVSTRPKHGLSVGNDASRP